MSDEAKSLPRRWAVWVLFVLTLTAAVWWARTGADEFTGPPKTREEAVARVLGSSENVSATIAYVNAFAQRQSRLAPEFRSMRVVHELLLIGDIYNSPRGLRAGDSGYIDPGMLANPTIGQGVLPEVFAESPRGGYAFEFVGRDPTIQYQTDIVPYRSFVYIASPESAAVGPYTFALRSEDWQIHYTTEARVPTTLDPTVSEGMPLDASGAPPELAKPGLIGRLSAWGAGVRRRFSTSGNDVARGEARAIADLRALADAQNAFYLMLGARGFASVEALSDPGTLEGVPEMAPFVGADFTEAERDGYRYTFTGDRPTEAGQPRLYRDYSYVAVPIGSGPPGRRSFAIYQDNVIRVRTDGAPPLLIDPPLDGHQ